MLPPFDPVLLGVLTAAAEEEASYPHCGGRLNWIDDEDWSCPQCGAEWRDISESR